MESLERWSFGSVIKWRWSEIIIVELEIFFLSIGVNMKFKVWKNFLNWKFKNRSDIERIIQSFFNEEFIIRTGSRVNSATSKLSAQVLQTVRHAFSMLLKFSHCTNFQDNARSCIQVILSHGLKSCVYIYIINCVANCDITFFLIFIKRKRNENFVCSLDWKAERKKDGKISDKKWKSLDRNWKRSAAVQMSFH